MNLPATPAPVALVAINATFYNAALGCMARGAWPLTAARDALPSTPGGILGSAFHQVMRAANNGTLLGDLAAAKAEFDRYAKDRLNKAHPLLRTKFPSIERLPYYHQRRSSAATMAARVQWDQARPRNSSGQRVAQASMVPANASRLVERKFQSHDGLIVGVIDLLEPGSRKITDYKSGVAPRAGSNAITEAERRQLRLYAHLARENDVAVDIAEIVRANGAKGSLSITEDEASKEGDDARTLRDEFNRRVQHGASLKELANPGRETCSGCQYIPFCEAFWEAATPEWEDSCGTHAEGLVQNVRHSQTSSVLLDTVVINVARGTVSNGEITVEQIPQSWLGPDPSVLAVGSRIRVVQAARQNSLATPDSRNFRVDRLKTTAVWNI